MIQNIYTILKYLLLGTGAAVILALITAIGLDYLSSGVIVLIVVCLGIFSMIVMSKDKKSHKKESTDLKDAVDLLLKDESSKEKYYHIKVSSEGFIKTNYSFYIDGVMVAKCIFNTFTWNTIIECGGQLYRTKRYKGDIHLNQEDRLIASSSKYESRYDIYEISLASQKYLLKATSDRFPFGVYEVNVLIGCISWKEIKLPKDLDLSFVVFIFVNSITINRTLSSS